MYKRSKRKFSGMTLIEALMAIAVFTIGIEGFALLFIKTWQHNKYTLEMGQSSMAVSQGVSKLGGYLRRVRQADDGSYPIKSASANDLVVYCDYDKDEKTERLHFYKNAQNIIMGITEPNDTFPVTYNSGDQQTQIIASSIVNTSDDPMFQYFDQSYTGGSSESPLASPVSVSRIRMIRIFLKINIDPNNAPDNIETETFIGLRNLSDYDRIE
jgi:Tfp pilus assembly protein PilV